MEYIILGLLMMNKLTAYQISKVIKENYEGICSSSLGNVQRALKILHGKGGAIYVEDGKKKIFEITAEGRVQFLQWLSTPPDILKVNNLESGKILLLGFLLPEKRLEMIGEQIKSLKEALQYTKAIEESIAAQKGEMEDGLTAYRQNHIAQNKEYFDELLKSTHHTDALTLMEDVSKFAIITLDHAIAEIKFHIQWFENMREELS